MSCDSFFTICNYNIAKMFPHQNRYRYVDPVNISNNKYMYISS